MGTDTHMVSFYTSRTGANKVSKQHLTSKTKVSFISICNIKGGKELVVRAPEGGKKLFDITKSYRHTIFSHKIQSMKTTKRASQYIHFFPKTQYFRMLDLSNPFDAYPPSKY